MKPDKLRPVVIKRKKIIKANHGGTWKIAYADFITAMMAFFLLMWLLGSTTKGDLLGISEYFQMPLKVALSGGASVADSSSVIKGGGTDITRIDGQKRAGDPTATVEQQRDILLKRLRLSDLDFPIPPSTLPLSGQATDVLLQDQERLEALKAKIEKLMSSSPQLAALRKQLLLDMTDDGLRIQILDDQRRPMFDLSSSALQEYAQDLLQLIGISISEVPNAITISGHTDSLSYKNGPAGYSNWELSTERANAARREMIKAGLSDSKVLQVIGLGSSSLLDPDLPTNPMNRRISIVILNKTAEQKLLEQRQKEVKRP